MYSVVGISSRDCNATTFGQLALQANQISARLQAIQSNWPTHQFYLLSTCHRLELYSYGPAHLSHRALSAWLKTLGMDTQAPYYAYWGRPALQHLFKVAAGLESIVPGDDQIVQQVRQAYQVAVQHQTVGAALHGALQTALMVAKQVRTETQLNRGHQSIPSAGIRLATELLGDLRQRSALIVGAGDTSLRCAQIIHKAGGKLFFLNRTHEKAVALAHQFEGKAVTVADIATLGSSLELITLAIDADRPIHDYRKWIHAIKQRAIWIDFSMPAQVPADLLPEHHGYINLQRIADQQKSVLGSRKAQMPLAQALIENGVDTWLRKQAKRSKPSNEAIIEPSNFSNV